MISGVYYIYCCINKKGYVGSSYNILSRWSCHRSNLRNGRHKNTKMQNAYNKYGADKFEYKILIKCPEQYCIKLEQWFKDKSNLDTSFNIRKECLSNNGLKLSESAKQKLRIKAIGRKFSSEVIERLSKLKKQKIKEDNVYREKLLSNIIKNPIGERNPNAKITNDIVIEIRKRINNGEKVCKIKNDYNCSQSMLYEIKNYKNWKHVK